MKINIQPKNKEEFRKLKEFASEIKDVCGKIGVKPVVWGGLAYFGYTKDKNTKVGDIDFLVPKKYLKKIMKKLDEKGFEYKFYKDWDLIIIKKGKLKVEIDPIERYCKGKRFRKFDFNGFEVRVVSLKELIRMYRKASEVSKDKPEQHRKRLEVLERLE